MKHLKLAFVFLAVMTCSFALAAESSLDTGESGGTNMLLSLLFFLAGLTGAWWHWFEVSKRTGDGGFSGFVRYMFTDNKAASGKALTAFLTAMFGMFSIGAFDMVRMDAFMEATRNIQWYPPMMLALYAAFVTGYTADSKYNSGSVKPDGDVIGAEVK